MSTSAWIYIALFLLSGLCFANALKYQSFIGSAAGVSRLTRHSPAWPVYLLAVILVVGIRDNVGIDYQEYVRRFYLISQARRAGNMEPAFVLLNRLVANVGGEPWHMFFISAAITNALIVLTILRYSPIPAVSMFAIFGMGFFFFQLSGVRQALGISIGFFSFVYLDRRQVCRFILSVAAAATFHISLLILIPAYWIAARRISLQLRLVLFLLAIISVYSSLTIDAIRSAIELLAPTEYAHYAELMLQSQGSFRSGYFVSLQILFFAFLTARYGTIWEQFNATERKILNLAYVGFVLRFVLIHLFTVTRLANNYTIFEVLLFAILLVRIPRPTRRMFLLYVVFLLFITNTFYYLYVNSYDALPYASILTDRL